MNLLLYYEYRTGKQKIVYVYRWFLLPNLQMGKTSEAELSLLNE